MKNCQNFMAFMLTCGKKFFEIKVHLDSFSEETHASCMRRTLDSVERFTAWCKSFDAVP